MVENIWGSNIKHSDARAIPLRLFANVCRVQALCRFDALCVVPNNIVRMHLRDVAHAYGYARSV